MGRPKLDINWKTTSKNSIAAARAAATWVRAIPIGSSLSLNAAFMWNQLSEGLSSMA